MYSYINGEITEITTKYVTCEIAGIGYQLFVSNPFSYSLELQKVYVYQHVKEDELTLYGFKTDENKKMFLDLISVKGIGPKTALAILAVDDEVLIKQAIVKEDIAYLQKFPKIGKKAAQQIIIDLSGKYELGTSIEIQSEISSVSDESEVIEALVSLGYSNKDLQKYIKLVDSNLTTEEKIKEVLKLMMK